MAAVEVRFVDEWPGDFTPLIAGDHCSAREHGCAVFTSFGVTRIRFGLTRSSSEGVDVELESGVHQSVGLRVPTVHTG